VLGASVVPVSAGVVASGDVMVPVEEQCWVPV
jgi:hypothetical protein